MKWFHALMANPGTLTAALLLGGAESRCFAGPPALVAKYGA